MAFQGNFTDLPVLVSNNVILEPEETIQLQAVNISNQVKFVVVQGHHQRGGQPIRISYLDPATVNEEQELPHGSFYSGSSVGLVIEMGESDSNSSVWMTNLKLETVSVLVQVVFYSATGEFLQFDLFSCLRVFIVTSESVLEGLRLQKRVKVINNKHHGKWDKHSMRLKR